MAAEAAPPHFDLMPMKYLIDGQEVPFGAIEPPPMNYGQHWRWEGHKCCRYRLVLTTDEFCGRVSQHFARMRREVAEDIDNNPSDWNEWVFTEFRDLGFPSLPVLLRERPDLLAELLRWANLELLNWLTDPDPSPEGSPHYSANSVDACIISGGFVSVEGMAYGTR